MSLSDLGIFVSIRSPHRSKGRPILIDHTEIGSLFQSAPLTEARGDSEMNRRLIGWLLFQSAPLTEARGDIIPASKLLSILVSIRSPHRSKGRLLSCGGSGDTVLFQSAPLTEARGDCYC